MDRFKAQYAQSLWLEATRLRSLASRTDAMLAAGLLGTAAAAALNEALLHSAAAMESEAGAIAPRGAS